MSESDVADIRSSLHDQAVRLARMEERQVTVYRMLETSLSNYADLVNRVTALEKLKAHFYFAAALVGTCVSVFWELIKVKVFQKG